MVVVEAKLLSTVADNIPSVRHKAAARLNMHNQHRDAVHDKTPNADTADKLVEADSSNLRMVEAERNHHLPHMRADIQRMGTEEESQHPYPRLISTSSQKI